MAPNNNANARLSAQLAARKAAWLLDDKIERYEEPQITFWREIKKT
jgi:hypothetical protein